ncbi:MAG: HD domain-containing protein [Methanosarcinales archaeon]|nr:HD domain-containing protein [Methanosarcinales archaeon]
MNLNKIANFFFEIASMRRIKRAHSQVIHEADDNISDHSFRVAVIGMILAKMEKCDTNKVLKMCLFHDVAEIRIGDANFINQQYSDLREEEAREDQMEDLPITDEVLELLREFEQRESKESIVAKDADLLDQMVLQREYFHKDKQNHKIWQNHTEKSLKTESAKKLAQKIRTSNPFEWLYRLAEHKAGIKADR